MSAFDKTWLTQREPADRRARNEMLLSSFAADLNAADGPVIVDIGCGTGSTPRVIAQRLQQAVRWRLFDHDQRLLDEAAKQLGGDAAFEFVQGDLNDLGDLPLRHARFVTASALFDLCSDDFIGGFVTHIAQYRIGLYAALNYDGTMRWSKSHKLDEAITARFNAHQRTDKGFGVSLGPDAWRRLAELLRAADYRVEVGSSPWIMTAEDADLQQMFLQGVADAVTEDADLGGPDVAEWLQFRLEAITAEGSSCHVGHQDVLAFP